MSCRRLVPVTVAILKVVFLLSLLSSIVNGSTHWVVTEEGKVQEQLESPFAINQPHNLVAFMQQETNHEKMQKLKEVLMFEKKAIEDNEDKNLDLEEKHYRKDEDCQAAGKQLEDFDLFVSSVLPLENKEIEVSDFIDLTAPEPGTKLGKPDCVNMSDLKTGESTYDNLEGVENRDILNELYPAESGLKTTMKYMDNTDQLANAIDSALKKNSSSWVAYNLATFYWRMEGDAEKAIECVRRALHFSPPQYKDIPLVNLANILHRSRFSVNASIVMEDALKVSNLNVIHFTLGSIYAALGEFVKSIEHFEKTLDGQPEFVAAKKRLHAVKCQHKLQVKLEAQHESLQRTLRELEAYQEKHKKYIELYQNIEKMQLSRREQINMHFLLMQNLIKEGEFDHKLCKFKSNESGPVMYCNLPKQNADKEVVDDDLIPNLNSRNAMENKEKDVRGHMTDAQPTTFASGSNSGKFEEPVNVEDVEYADWSDDKWPSEDHCKKHAPRNLAWDEYPSSYINPQMRGFRVHELLTSYIGVKEGEYLDPPWTELDCESLEPICDKTTSIDKIRGVIDRHSAPMHKQDEYMKRELLLHVNEGRIWPGDLGHRINTAIKKSLKEKDEGKNLWILYDLAGLFHRVQGDNLKAVECIRRAAHRTPKEHYDVPLLNMANIMYRLGKINDALTPLLEALGVNQSEPMTYLAVGNALHAKGNSSGAATFYRYGLYLDNNFRADFYALLNSKCAAMRDEKLKMNIARSKAPIESKEISCEKDPLKCKIEKVDDIMMTEAEGGKVYRMEQTAEGSKMYTVHTMTTQKSRPAECDNVSEESDLVRRLESTKVDADKILNDANNVIERLAHIEQESAEELSMRVSSARQIMQQLSQMRDSLGSLVEEASSSLGDVGVEAVKYARVNENFTPSDCAHALHNTDLRFYLSSNMDVSTLGYNFTEEFPPPRTKIKSNLKPHCIAPSSTTSFNLDDRESVRNLASVKSYDEEYGMELLLKQIILTHVPSMEFNRFILELSQGLRDHPNSWRLSYLASYYWRMKGKPKKAIECLRLSLATAPFKIRDVVLLGFANIFAQLSHWEDAIYVTQQALLLSPNYYLYQFTLGNIFAAMGNTQASIPYFKRSMELKPELEIAQKRFEAAVCQNQRPGVH